MEQLRGTPAQIQGSKGREKTQGQDLSPGGLCVLALRCTDFQLWGDATYLCLSFSTERFPIGLWVQDGGGF